MTNFARRIAPGLRFLHRGLDRTVRQVPATGPVVSLPRLRDVNRFRLWCLQLVSRRVGA
jgi:hypothetical protein